MEDYLNFSLLILNTLLTALIPILTICIKRLQKSKCFTGEIQMIKSTSPKNYNTQKETAPIVVDI